MAGSASIGGIISGLDTESIVSELTSLRRAPQVRLQGRKTALQKQLEAWDALKTQLTSLKNAAAALRQAAAFTRTTGTSSNSDLVTVATTPDAAPGTYTVTVLATAQAHQMLSQGYTDLTSPVLGTGTVRLQVGSGTQVAIAIDSSNNSLAGLRDAINRAGAGVTAAIIHDGSTESPYRLVLTANGTGESNRITFSSDLAGGAAPAFTTLQEARNAQVQLGEGGGALVVSKPTNSITDLIPGATLNLVSADAGKTVTVTVSRDASATASAIRDLVDAYNSVVGFITTQAKYDAQTNTGGPLMGDPSLLLIQNDILGVVSNQVIGAPAALSAIGQIGIAMQGDGTLKVDDGELMRALSDNPGGVAKIFAAVGEASQSNVRYITSTNATRPSGSAGFAVSVSRVATRARVTAGAAQTEPLASNETLTINGHEIALTAGMTQAQVVAAINALTYKTGVIARATGADGTGTGSYLTLECSQYGSAYTVSAVSSVSNGGGTPASNRTGIGTTLVTDSSPAGESGVGTGQSGLDVAGTIHGEAATGSGQMLTGAAGNPTTEGLVLQVAATAPGHQGVVVFTRGVASELDRLIEQFTQGAEYTIQRARAEVEERLADIAEDMKRADERLATLQERLRSQFNRMEGMLAKLQSQGASLAQQIASLSNGVSIGGKK